MKAKTLFLTVAVIAMFAACKRGGYEVANTDRRSSSADTVANDSAGPDTTPKLVKTADMTLKVKSVQQTGDSISSLTTSYYGMVIHHQMNARVENSQDIRLSDDSIMRVSAFNTAADMTVKIPSEKIGEFLTRVSRMGLYVTSRQMDIQDKSLDYLSSRLKLKSRKELVAHQKRGKITIKNPEAVLWLKDDMIDGQISNQRIDEEVKYSIVSLNFYQSNTIMKEMVANDDPSAYQLPFFKRLLMAFANGWFIFKEIVLGLANLWVLLLVGAAIWAGFKFYKRKYPALKV